MNPFLLPGHLRTTTCPGLLLFGPPPLHLPHTFGTYLWTYNYGAISFVQPATFSLIGASDSSIRSFLWTYWSAQPPTTSWIYMSSVEQAPRPWDNAEQTKNKQKRPLRRKPFHQGNTKTTAIGTGARICKNGTRRLGFQKFMGLIILYLFLPSSLGVCSYISFLRGTSLMLSVGVSCTGSSLFWVFFLGFFWHPQRFLDFETTSITSLPKRARTTTQHSLEEQAMVVLPPHSLLLYFIFRRDSWGGRGECLCVVGSPCVCVWVFSYIFFSFAAAAAATPVG